MPEIILIIVQEFANRTRVFHHMPATATQPDLIISLSQDKVRLKLVEDPQSGRTAWETSFDVDHIFLEDQISSSLDRIMLENPVLIDDFPCVEIIMLDRPNICVSGQYQDEGQLGQIASRHLRKRIGDTLASDPSENNAVICYTVPTGTLTMLKEYYANAGCCHLASVLWH